METVVDSIWVHDKDVRGCVRFARDVMIDIETDGEMHDFFLTQKQAEALYKRLGEVLKYNVEGIR